MKLIIDIDEDMYKSVCRNDDVYVLDDADCILIENAIANGTPHETVTEFADRCRDCGREKILNKIRAEVESIDTVKELDNNSYMVIIKSPQMIKDEVLEIIDKYKTESEG